MLTAEFSTAFAGELEAPRGRAGPFDRVLVGRALGQIFAEALAQPLPEEWRSLLQRLDEPPWEADPEDA